eukprot:TRINITY_DN1364_c3_g1_i1.p1 TRINITY_DN1364_c3_g1~~TRINITY_DN1364_c3_g1_i1.p1  ORF type:complete len:331 (+),score=87.98 TRINITY_DN1364_c3_g1_i1:149-994(+)
MSKIKIVRVSISGEDFMVPYEVSFETNASDLQIAFPDPYQCTKAHLDELMKRHHLCRVGQLFRHFYLNCFGVIAHEVIHIVQGLLKQVDKSPGSWSAEHDASYVRSSLLLAVAQDPSMSDIFVPGFLEQILMNDVQRAFLYKNGWSSTVLDEYNRWRDSLGLHAPSKSISCDAALSNQFKYVVAMDQFCNCDFFQRGDAASVSNSKSKLMCEAILVEQLRLIFEQRSGDVLTTKKLVVPELFSSASSSSPMAYLSRNLFQRRLESFADHDRSSPLVLPLFS